MKKSVLIIGGTGFIGFHLAKHLLKLKWKVTSISLHKPKKHRKLNSVNYLIIDVSKKKEFRKLNNQNFSYVVNLGGYVNHINKTQIKKYHYIAVKNLFEYFKNKKIKNFLQVGSSAEYGKSRMPQKENFDCNPIGTYGKYKLKATNFLLQKKNKFNFPATIARLYQVFGPHQDPNRFLSILIYSCVNKNIFYASNGMQKRDFLYISDVIQAFKKILLSSNSVGQIFNIGSGKSTNLREIMLFVAKKTHFFSPIYGKIKIRKDEALDIYPAINKAKKMLNWKPKVKLNLGILRTIQYYKKLYGK